MRSKLLLVSVVVLGACKSDAKVPPSSTPGSTATAGSGSVASGGSSSAPAVPAGWERKDLSKLELPIPVIVDLPRGVTVELHQITYGSMPGPTNAADLVGPDWTVSIEAIRDDEAASVAAAIRGRTLAPEMVVTSKDLPDGGWVLVWKQPTNEHFLASVRKAANVVCDGSGPIKAQDVETVLKVCDSILPAR